MTIQNGKKLKKRFVTGKFKFWLQKNKTSKGKLPPRSRLCVNDWALSDMGLFSPPVLKNVVNVDIHLVTLAK